MRLLVTDDHGWRRNRPLRGDPLSEVRARRALEAQGFREPGPKLIELVADAIARGEEHLPAGQRTIRFHFAEILADTPELADRAEGPLTNARAEGSDIIEDVISHALGRMCSTLDTAHSSTAQPDPQSRGRGLGSR
jgi:hypothetical protein